MIKCFVHIFKNYNRRHRGHRRKIGRRGPNVCEKIVNTIGQLESSLLGVGVSNDE